MQAVSRRLRDQSGYSLIEVLVAILLLSIAIIPMVGMFDAGLRAASTSGNYDKVRALANMKLEEAKSLPYAMVRDNFPSGTGAPSGGSDSITSNALTAPSGFPSSLKYTVRKQYLKTFNSNASSQGFTGSGDSTDTKLIKVTVTVGWDGASWSGSSWSGGKTYTTDGVVAE